ncbi:MAG: biopolymer transporter ExbD [Prevotellaceae bacterium]|jgi:biopolymer transport protein ExbD|nr:biopolymer transporter ExbD [Prevotellaceae bacterium]
MASKKVPEINASSTADIAFLLLVFFLVTTTMDTDNGLVRKLPPMPQSKQKQEVQQVNKRNVLPVLVNSSDRLLVNGEPTDISQLRAKTKEFIVNPNNNPHLSAKKMKQFDGLGNYMVSEGVVSLQNDRATSYQMYIKVQNELIAAFNELRDELSMQQYGKKYLLLLEDQQNIIKDVYPQRISEAEPKNIGGK